MVPAPEGATEPATGTLPAPESDPAGLESEVERAIEVFRAGRPAAAARMLRSVRRRAMRMAPDVRALAVVARTFLSEAAPHFDMTGDLEGALALIDRAEDLARQAGSPALAAKVAGQRALVALRSGDTRRALPLFNLAALNDAATPHDQALTMVNRAVVHLEHADLARAEADLVRGIEYADRAADARLGAMARHNLGYVSFLAGRIPRALAAFEDAARMFPGGAHPAMRLDHARALREAGLVRDADAILAQAARQLGAERLIQDLGETELVRAQCALDEHDPRRARALATAARRRFVRRGNVRWQRKAELLLLQCDVAALRDRAGPGRHRTLLGVAARAAAFAAECRSERRPDLARLAALVEAECRLRAGHPPGSLPRIRPADPLPVRLQVRELRALDALRQGDDARAMGEVRRGLAELRSYQGGLGSLDLRTAVAKHGVALAQLGLGHAVDRGAVAEILATVERSRAISTRLPAVRPPSDDRTARLVGELRQAEEEMRGLEGDPDRVGEAARLRSRVAALQRDIRARAWEVEGGGSLAIAAPRLSDVRSAVRARGSTFVTYARHRGVLLAVVVRPRGAEVVDLGPTGPVADLARRVRVDLDALAMPHLPGPISTAVRSSMGASLRRLDDLLLAPLHLEREPVVVSCSGPLSVLPWNLLPSRSGLPTVITPAAGTWLRADVSPGRSRRLQTVAVAGPGLHRSETEAREVSGVWPRCRLLVGDDASTHATRSALARTDLLHVAAHGQHRTESPLFSSLRLADGPLYAYELHAEDGAPGCVILSACEAALATLRPGDEGLGLTHVLLQLGARSVVAGVARVRDDVAASIMARLHRGMAAGLSSAAALARAQADADPDAPPAPFGCFGADW